MVNKHKQKKKKNFRNYGKNNKELNALIEEKFQKFVENKKGEKQKKSPTFFQEIQISDNESKNSVSSLAKRVESGEIPSSSSE